jgi:Fe-S cluster assembly protein SufD
MKYSKMELPSRADHLWRYTPWKRIHPSTVETIPDAVPFRWEIDEGGVLTDGMPRVMADGEIARVFLSELGKTGISLSTDGTQPVVHIRAVASGHTSVGHLHFDCDKDVTVIIHLSGEAEWAGLHITGSVKSNVRAAIGFVNELSANSKLLRCEDWTVQRDATLEMASLSIGGFRCKNDLRTRLTGTGGSLTQAISVHGHDQRHVDHHIEIHHDIGHTTSDLHIHAACNDESHSISTGLLTIAEAANHSDAGQVFKNLLLSERSRAEAIPELEVLADEVSANHGAASSPVNSEQMHYLMSRGLGADEATSLIIEGFMQDGFSALNSKALVDEMRTRLTVHLECELMR